MSGSKQYGKCRMIDDKEEMPADAYRKDNINNLII
jgi:hypothetical protein